jgi:hypothetical protein
VPRSSKAPTPAATRTIVFASHMWRDRLAQELIATAGLGHDMAKLVAVRVLKNLVKGESGEPEPDGHDSRQAAE